LDNYFNRQIQLWGKDTQDSLQNKSIAIIGSGGLGSSVSIALGATGIGKIHLIDFDEVSLHNIHRQIAFKMGDEGMFKSEVTKELLEARCPYVKVEAYTKDFEAFTKENIVVDLIIDATDNLPIRAEIDKYAKLTKTPWIYGSVEAWNGQVCFFDKSSFDIFKITNRKPAGITAPIVMHIASMQANLALRYLTNASVKKDYLYYLFFDDDGIFQMQKFSLPQ